VLELDGRLEDLKANLRVRANRVRYAGRDFESGTLRLEFAGGVLSINQLRLRDGESSVVIVGDVAFPGGEPISGRLKLEAKELNLAGLEQIIGAEGIGLDGVGSGSVEIVIGPEITGSGKVAARSLKVGELRFERADAEIRFGDRWSLRNLDAVGSDGELVQGSIDFDPANQDWNAALRGRGLRLEHYAELFAPGLEVEGNTDFDLDASGHRFAASGVLDFSVRGSQVAGMPLGDFSGRLRADGKKALLSLSSGETSYKIRAELSEGEEQVMHLSLEENNLDITGLVRHFVDNPLVYLQIRDGVSASIPLGGDSIVVDLVFGKMIFGIDKLSVNSVGEVGMRFADDQLYFKDIRVDQGGNQITLGGSIAFGDATKLELNIEGGVNLLAVSDFFGDFSFSGRGELDLQLRGTLQQPMLYGDARVFDAYVRHKESNVSFSKIQGDLKIEGSRVEVVGATAVFSGGIIDLDGFVNIDWAAMQPTAFQFNIEGSAVGYSIPDELDVTFDASIIFSGERNSSVLSGDIDISRALFTKRIDPESELLRSGQAQPLPVASEELRNVRLDLDVKGDDGVIVDNNFADMELILDLHLLGTAAEPVLTGRAEVKQGQVYYRDRRYSITTGVIDFVNPYRLEPHFDFRAETQVKEYRIFLEFHGTFDRLYPTLSSDPAESTIDILHLLAVGKVRDNPFPSDTERLQEQLLGLALSGFITRQVTGQLEQRAEKLFGIDRFRIDPFFPGGSNNLSPRVTVGEQITDRLSVIYSRNLSELAEQVLVFEYRISPTMLLVGSREEDGSYAIDVHLQHRFR